MEIRTYRDPDHAQVARLWSFCFDYPAPHNDPAQSIRLKQAMDDGLFFVAEIDGAVAGTVMAGWDGHRGWIYSLAVQSGLRRRGIGRALLEHAVAELTSRGCPKVNLQVMSDNLEATGFYERLGFSVEDRISMGRRLY